MSYRIFNDQNYAYFVTWTIVDWLPLFNFEPYRVIVLEALAYMRTNKKTQLNAFVIMPSHIHAILWPEVDIHLSNVIRDFKRFTSREISKVAAVQNDIDFLDQFEYARSNNRAQDASRFQIWQEGSHPEAIFSEKFAKQKLDYIHMNPVKAGLVQTPDEWLYSSAQAYLLGTQTNPITDLLAVR
jgi:REP element-mobilizing transposase RayT